jgi:hypothetical protein
MLPHSIRLDPHGNVWTVDAASSAVIKYSSAGKALMTLHVGGQPQNGSAFNGTTDIAFGPDGQVFVTDGYGNARVLEYTADGRLLRQWGHHGSGPGEFHLPHSIQAGKDILYVADRENGRIEKFDMRGRYLGEISGLGRVYSLRLTGDVLWASMGSLEGPAGAGNAWVVKLDSRTGKILGHLDIAGPRAGHGMDVTPSGEPIVTHGNEVLWCRAGGSVLAESH